MTDNKVTDNILAIIYFFLQYKYIMTHIYIKITNINIFNNNNELFILLLKIFYLLLINVNNKNITKSFINIIVDIIINIKYILY